MSYLLNRVDTPETEQYLRDALKEHRIVPDGVLRTRRELSQAWLYGRSFSVEFRTDRTATELVDKLEHAVPG